jgi:hypothetical protein
VCLRPRLRLLMQPIHVRLELVSVYAPDASPPQFDRRQLPRSHQRVDLRDADVEVDRDILESEEARLDDGPRRALIAVLARGGCGGPHEATIAPGAVDSTYLTPFARVWSCPTSLGMRR